MIKTVSNALVRVSLLSSTALVLAGVCFSGHAEVEYRGSGALQQRYYLQDELYPQQQRTNLSWYGQAEVYYDFNDGDDSILFKPFYRIDQSDEERNHGDIRELLWLHVADSWELRTGISKVFWGQTESLHLVDIINQTDNIEYVDGEDKLGQPMVNLSIITDWGTTSFFVLPYFRERTFAGEEGRPRFALPVDTNNPVYESSDEEKHVDLAVRWQKSLGAWDVGVSYFDGTSREPILLFSPDSEQQTVTPYYEQIQQVGIDALGALGSWLIKFEGIHRESNQDRFFATVAGFERTSVGIFDSIYDLGLLMEYQYDERENLFQTTGQNDLMIGSRLVFNDIDGTEILMGIVQDLDESSSRTGFIEASSRINDNWRWRFDAWFFSSDVPNDPVYWYRRDDFAELSLEYYF